MEDQPQSPAPKASVGEIILAANSALALLEVLLPIIKRAVSTGEVSQDDQQKVWDNYNSLRTAADSAFQGPEWDLADPPTQA
jgi:hypothetical protein